MKKFLTLLTIMCVVSFMRPAQSCTNFLITPGASADGSSMISYAADSHVLYGELYHYPAADYPEGAMRQIVDWDSGRYVGQIPEVAHTYNVVGNMNEWQLAIAETTYGGLPNLGNPEGLIDYGSLIYITLQRSKTAREAIKTMAELVANYGYMSDGESFSIADPNEVWIMELIGKGQEKGAVWVALRVPDGYVSAHANQARITTFPLANKHNKNSITSKHLDKLLKNPNIDCVYAEDVISFAKKNNLYAGPDGQFSFSDVYAPVDFSGARACEIRVWAMFNQVVDGMDQYWDYATGRNINRAKPYVSGEAQTPENFPTNRMPLWVKPNEKVSVLDMMAFMRDHLEGTELDMTQDIGGGPFHCPYRARPMGWEVDGVEYVHERATATQQTGFSFVAQCRPNTIDNIGGIIWFGVDDAASTVYCPMYTCMTDIPLCFREGNGNIMEYSETAAFWVFNQVTNWAYTKYSYIHPEIAEKQAAYEQGWVESVKHADAKAAKLYEQNPAEAVKFLTSFSSKEAENLTADWREFYKYLFVKYMDFNVKTKQETPKSYKYYAPKVEQPKYSDDYYRAIIQQTGDKLKVY
ncbi:MAG: C69 family dipeptidase [Bacteroidales bacterium]|nr:C69 family dipeptidase [Bacteroidales bacterium]